MVGLEGALNSEVHSFIGVLSPTRLIRVGSLVFEVILAKLWNIILNLYTTRITARGFMR